MVLSRLTTVGTFIFVPGCGKLAYLWISKFVVLEKFAYIPLKN